MQLNPPPPDVFPQFLYLGNSATVICEIAVDIFSIESMLAVQAGLSFRGTFVFLQGAKTAPLKSMGNRYLSHPSRIGGRILTTVYVM